jgi:hypothetical protein
MPWLVRGDVDRPGGIVKKGEKSRFFVVFFDFLA